MYFYIATQTGWQISELDNLPLSEVKQYFDMAMDWIKIKVGGN